ncbi:hypothetical protein [Angustibacter luteus]|uniref:DUF1795 domain-containing protein n=1 Tax=Angustibacter luteus TaxID=658456 RepID=A0ABW1J8G9_9ACTN
MLRRTALLLVLGVVAVTTAGCSGDGGSSSQPAGKPTATPAVTPGAAPADTKSVTVGPISIAVPTTMTLLSGLSAQPGQTVVGYRTAAPGADGRSGALVVTTSVDATRTAQAEAEALAKAKVDLHQAKDVQVAPVTWPGLDSAYTVTYEDASGTAAGQQPLHTLVLIGTTADKKGVNVTAKAPPDVFTSQSFAQIVGSVRAAGTSS